MSANEGTEPLATLISRIVANGQRLAKAQVALVQAEAKETGKQVGQISVFALIAAMGAGLFLLFLLVTLAYVLVAIGLPTWAGFGIITLLLLIVVIVFVLLAKNKAESMKGPQLAIDELNTTKAALEALTAPSADA